MSMLKKIDDIECAIFDYDISKVMGDTVNIFSEIIEKGLIDVKNDRQLYSLNTIMNDCLKAMQYNDYLLLADYLEYNLKPIIGEN